LACYLSQTAGHVNGFFKYLLIGARKTVICPVMDAPQDIYKRFMGLALDQARLAASMDEVPVGAVLVNDDNEVIASDHNRTITRCDPSAHAEMNVLRSAALRLRNYRLIGTTLYVTVEPCAMCMGAIVHARVKTVVFGAADPKWGAAGSLYQIGQDFRLNHQVETIPGVCEEQCRRVIQQFFRDRRPSH
jgi:tRNA(adenine34) deaminase